MRTAALIFAILLVAAASAQNNTNATATLGTVCSSNYAVCSAASSQFCCARVIYTVSNVTTNTSICVN